jgi:hypothetical protein
MRRSKKQTLAWRLMARYEALKSAKGSGKSIIATARKVATIIWVLLQRKTEFDASRMTDKKLARKAASMQAAHYKNNPV